MIISEMIIYAIDKLGKIIHFPISGQTYQFFLARSMALPRPLKLQPFFLQRRRRFNQKYATDHNQHYLYSKIKMSRRDKTLQTASDPNS
jgi:hypothetical protein